MATLRIGLNGSSIQRAFVAENLKISRPLLITTKVWKKKQKKKQRLENLKIISSFKYLSKTVISIYEYTEKHMFLIAYNIMLGMEVR